jgi:hypothetical protein
MSSNAAVLLFVLVATTTTTTVVAGEETIYDFKVDDIQGNTVDFSHYRGKVRWPYIFLRICRNNFTSFHSNHYSQWKMTEQKFP